VRPPSHLLVSETKLRRLRGIIVARSADAGDAVLTLLIGRNVSVESQPGKRSVFLVTLPVRQFSAVPQEAGAVPDLTSNTGRIDGPAPSQLVLVIDDDDSARYLPKKTLSDLPVSLAEAARAEDGIRIAREMLPSVVLLDLNMPGLSGSEALRRLKNDPSTSEIPVIIVTSQPLTTAEREELIARAKAILSKENLLSDKLLGEVNRVLSRSITATD
jgi:CheY-like chemotaxis protein